MITSDDGSGGRISRGMRGDATDENISGYSNCAIFISAPIADSGCNNSDKGDLLANRWIKLSAVFLR